jgi:hypothetical protein
MLEKKKERRDVLFVTLALLPTDADDDELVAPCTLHLVYRILHDAFSLQGFSAGDTLYVDLHALHCCFHVQNYVTKWHAGISQLCSAHYHLSFPFKVITSFLDCLPASVPFQVLHCQVLKEIDTIHFDDIVTTL